MCASATSLLQQLDRQHLVHPFTDLSAHQEAGGTIMCRGSGVRVWDTAGRDYIDGLAGLWCVNVGYGRREIRDAVARQIEGLAYYHAFGGMGSEPAVRLAARLADMAPEGFSKVFFGQSGSDANDTAIKIVRYVWNACGRPRKKEVRRPPAGLSWRHAGGRVPDRSRVQPSRFRCAGILGRCM